MQPDITYGYANTPFGKIRISFNQGLIQTLYFVKASEKQTVASTPQDDLLAQAIIDLAFKGREVGLDLKGTPFQLCVWKELLKVRKGETISYEGLARRIGKPTATRAVASAVARNPISIIIPCHRVIRKSGEIGNYRWGKELKKEILAYEQTKLKTQTN